MWDRERSGESHNPVSVQYRVSSQSTLFVFGTSFKILFQGLNSKVIALDIDGGGQVDFLCQTKTGYKVLPWGLHIPDGE